MPLTQYNIQTMSIINSQSLSQITAKHDHFDGADACDTPLSQCLCVQAAQRTACLSLLSAQPPRGVPYAQGWGGACPLRASASATWAMLAQTAAHVMRDMSGHSPRSQGM